MTFPLWLTTIDPGDDHAGRPSTGRGTESASREAPAALAPDEHALIQRIRGSDRDAMDALVRIHFEGMARYAECLVRSHDEAEDIVQEVLVRVWEHRAAWQPMTTVRAYLLGAVRNRVIDLQRRASSRARRDRQIDPVQQIAPPPDLALTAAEDAELLSRTINRLPAQWREVIALRYEQRLAFREVGRILGISEDAAKKLAQRAIMELRRTIGI